MEKIRILGGRSKRNSISIYSNKFVSTASLERNGEITCRTNELDFITHYFFNHKSSFIPKTVKMYLGFIADSSRISVLLFFAVLYFFTFLPVIYPKSLNFFLFISQYWFLPLIVYALSIVYINKKVSSWHGAEHMAIEAYKKNGSTSIEEMIKESPINEKCGSRFLLPFAATFVLSKALKFIPVSNMLIWLILIEAVMIIDKRFGWEKVPINAEVSVFIQRYFTTRIPTETELKVAQTAMMELLECHRLAEEEKLAAITQQQS